MCWTSRKTKSIYPPSIAKRDIPVWKVLRKYSCGKITGLYRHDIKYNQKGLYTARNNDGRKMRKFIIPRFIWGNFSIDPGLHFFLYKKDAETLAERHKGIFYKLIVRQFIIPKGTKYYANRKEGELVALRAIKVERN